MPEMCAGKGICGEYKIDIGCGDKSSDELIGVDISKHSVADIIHDVRFGLPFCTNSAKYITSTNFLEHLTIDEFNHLMWEIWRVLKPGGTFEASAGYGHSNTRWQDPTHKSGYTIKTFTYFKTGTKHQLLYDLPPFKNVETTQVGEIIKVIMQADK